MDGNALTPQEMRIGMQTQQAALLALSEKLISDFARIKDAGDEAAIERKAKNLALLTKAVHGVHELIDRFGETEMDESENTTAQLTPEERKSRYDARRAEVRLKLIDIATRLRPELLAEQAGSVDGRPSGDV